METRTIDAVAQMLAEQLYGEADGNANAHRGVCKLVIEDLAIQIKAHIRTLIDVGAIRARRSATGPTADTSAAINDTYILTSSDADEILHFVRLSKINQAEDYLEKFAKLKAAGRRTLKQAARIIAAESGEQFATIIEWFKEDARNGNLPTHESGRNQPIKYNAARHPRDDDEAVLGDLNKRLAKTNIAFRFPSLSESTKQTKKTHRRDILDPAIDNAIERAGNWDTNSVWLALKEIALSCEPPFTGSCKGGLAYTDVNNKIRPFTKDALQKRLKRRATADTPPAQ